MTSEEQQTPLLDPTERSVFLPLLPVPGPTIETLFSLASGTEIPQRNDNQKFGALQYHVVAYAFGIWDEKMLAGF